MLSRIGYSIKKCWHHRQALRDFIRDAGLQLPTIYDLSKANLKGVKALILDFDGVLAAHGELQPRADVIPILENLQGYKLYILSNKPIPERKAYFTQHFPDLVFVKAARKKPYPDGIEEILRMSKLEPQQCMVIDDRLATGVVAAIDTGVKALWITKPFVSIASKPIVESWFMFLRFVEKTLLA